MATVVAPIAPKPSHESPYGELGSFLERNHFDKNLRSYGHGMRLDEQGTPLLLCQGQWRTWEKVKELVGPAWTEKRCQSWSYLQDGLVPWSSTKWDKLAPMKVLPPEDRPPTHTLEIWTACKGEAPGLFSNYGHSWIRLVSPEGEVYSTGFYAPEEFIENPDLPIKTLKAVIHCPDPYEFVPRVTREKVSYPLSEDRFNETILLIERYQDLGILYNALEQNCGDFVKSILSFAVSDSENGLEKSSMDMAVGWYSSSPSWIKRPLKWLWNRTPSPIQMIISSIWKRVVALALSPLMWLLGGRTGFRYQDAHTGEEVEVEAVLPSYWRLLNMDVCLNHTAGVRRWQRQQESWQKV